MLTIRRIGRRSFEVFRYGVPLGIVRFLRDVKKWTFRPYPTLDEQNFLVEKSDTVLRNLLCPSGERCTVDRSNKGLRIDLESLLHNNAAFNKGALGEVAFHQRL